MNNPPPLPIVAAPKEEIGLIQGQEPMSINEWFVSLALDKLGLEYTYQYPIGPGSGIRGSQKIDFVVWQPTGGIPCYVQGAYWHDLRHDPDAIINQAAAEARFHNPVVLLMEEETNTKQKAYSVCLQRLM